MNENIINGALKLPRFISKEASDLIQRLLRRNPLDRIGAGPLGAQEIKLHPFFDKIDWNDVLNKKYKVPFKKKKTVEYTEIPQDKYMEAIGDAEENRFDNWSFIRAD